MIFVTRDQKEVEAEISYGKCAEDSFIQCAYYTDNGEEVIPASILDQLQEDYAAEVAEAWFEYQIGRADASYDSLMDR